MLTILNERKLNEKEMNLPKQELEQLQPTKETLLSKIRFKRRPDNSHSMRKTTSGHKRYYAFDKISTPGVSGHALNERVFDERAIPMATKDDIVFTMKMPDKAYLEYISKINIGPGTIIAVGDHKDDKRLIDGIKRHRKEIPILDDGIWIPYYTSSKDIDLSKNFTNDIMGSPKEAITLKHYSKDSFKEACRLAGVPTAEGVLFERRLGMKCLDSYTLSNIINKYSEATGSVIIRPVDGSGGAEILFASKENKDAQIKKILESKSRKFLIEVTKDVDESLTSFGVIYNGQINVFAVSKQILTSKVAYDGSIFDFEKPADPKVLEYTKKIGEQMIKDGYVGPFGIGFIKTKDGEILACEDNARINGSHPIYEFAQNLKNNGREFKHVISFSAKLPKPMSFEELSQDPFIRKILYNGTNKAGVFPFDTGLCKFGKFSGIALAHSPKKALELVRLVNEHFKNE